MWPSSGCWSCNPHNATGICTPGMLLTRRVQQPNGGGPAQMPGMPHSSGSFSAQPVPRQPPTTGIAGEEDLQGSPAQGPRDDAPTGNPDRHRKHAASDATDPHTDAPPSKRVRSGALADEGPLSSVSPQTSSFRVRIQDPGFRLQASRPPWDMMLQSALQAPHASGNP